MLRLVVLAILVLGIFLFSAPPTSYADEPSPFTLQTRAGFVVSASQQRAQKEDSKVSSVIRGVVQELESTNLILTNAQPGGYSALSIDNVLRVSDSGEVHAYVLVTSTDQDVIGELENLGARIELTNHDLNIVQAWIPFNQVDAIASLPSVKRIQPPGYAFTRSGSIQTQGDEILKGDIVRALYGFTGAGVRIGVISNGVDSWTDARDSGDLPSDIEIDPFRSGSGDEGTAMLEIIHDIAPDASLAFSGPRTSLEMDDSVNYLANSAFGGNGADIIVDDLGFLDQPSFEDGFIAQAVESVVANGTIYVSAAGNSAQLHYEGTYVPGVLGDHQFQAGDTGMGVLVQGGGSIRIVFQWNDKFGAATNDYDLLVCDFDDFGNFTCDKGQPDLGEDDPFEYQNPTGDDRVIFIFLNKVSGSAKKLEVFIYGAAIAIEYPVPQGSIFGHPAVDGAIAVGAIIAVLGCMYVVGADQCVCPGAGQRRWSL